MRILDITFHEFFTDTRQLVAEGVRKDIDHHLSNPPSGSTSSDIRLRARERENNLKLWLTFDNPLAYGDETKDKPFESLLQAVVADKQDIRKCLPHMMDNVMTPSGLVSSLMAMSHPFFPVAPYAPVLTNGSFLPTLKLAHSCLIKLAAPNPPEPFVKDMFLQAIKHFDISFIPFHLPQTGARGAPHKKPVFNSWAYLGLRDQGPPKPLPPPSDAPSFSQAAASMALTTVRSKDANAVWKIRPLHLKDIYSIINKVELPEDYPTPSLAGAAYVNETFNWVKIAYEPKKPLHHLAFLVSMMVSCLRPYLFLPNDPSMRSRFAKADTKDKVREVYNSLPWVAKKERKGLKDERILVSMFTTFIIALYEPTSPLRRHMATSKRNGLGDDWTKKYCTPPFDLSSILVFRSLILSPLPFLRIALKSITYPTLIRIGILWGVGPGAYEKGIFGEAWGLHSEKYIKRMYDTLIQKLTGSEDDAKSIFAPFDALTLLIGDRNARFFCRQDMGISARPPLNRVSQSIPNQTQTMSTHTEMEIIDVDMDVDIDLDDDDDDM